MLSERSQSQKATYYITLFIRNIWICKSMETNWISGCLELEEWVDLEVKASVVFY